MSKRAGILLTVAALSTTGYHAEFQNEQIGFSPNHVFEGALQGENVDVMTGNVNLSIPLGPRYMLNDWFGYQVMLYYNSRVWKHDCDHAPTQPVEDSCPGDFMGTDTYGLGFSISFGKIYQARDGGGNPVDYPGVYRYQTPSGGEHFFCVAYGTNQCNEKTNYTFDESKVYIQRLEENKWVAYPGDGTIIRFEHGDSDSGWYATKIETVARAPGGELPQHHFEIVYPAGSNTDSITRISDSAGRSIEFDWVEGVGREIVFPGLDDPYVLVFTQPGNGSTNPVSITDPSDRREAQPFTKDAKLLWGIELPALDPSEAYKFQYAYDNQPGLETYGSIASWTLPTGAEVEYYYTTYLSSYGKPFHRNMYLRRIKTLEGGIYDWTYTRFGSGSITSIDDWWAQQQGELSTGSNPHKVRVLDPFGNLTVYSFFATPYDKGDCLSAGCESNWNDGMLSSVSTYAGPAEDASRLVRKETNVYRQEHEDFQFGPSSGQLDRVNAVAINAGKAETHTHVPQHAGQPGGVHKTVMRNWTTDDVESGVSHYNVPPRPRLVEEFNGAVLYRSTYTDYPTYVNWDYKNAHNFIEVRDAIGNVLSRVDREFEINRIKCEVRRENGSGIDLPFDCDTADPGVLSLQGDDVATIRTYGAEDGELTQVVIHGVDHVDDRYTSTYHYEKGVLVEGEYEGLDTSWLAVDRTIDPATGRVVSSRDPSGYETEYAWDDLGRLEMIDPEFQDEIPTEIVYESAVRTVMRRSKSYDDKIEEVFEYDSLGRLTGERRRNLEGEMDYRRTKYDIAGRVTRKSEWFALDLPDDEPDDEDLDWTIFEYTTFPNPNPGPGEPAAYTDPLGRVSRVVYPDLAEVVTEYHGLTRVVTVKGVEGLGGPVDATTTYTDDVFGRLIAVDSPGDGVDAAYIYDERDNLVEVRLEDPSDATVQIRRFVYDGLGRLESTTHPEGGTVEYLDYDARGKNLRFMNARQDEFIHEYDAAGRLTKKSIVLYGLPGVGTTWPLVENHYDIGHLSGVALGRLTKQLSYQVRAAKTVLASTLRFGYGSSADCSATLNGGIDAYQGLNGRLAWSSMQIEPWGREMKTEYCQDGLGAPYLVSYPDFDGSGRTRTELSHLYLNGALWGVQDLGREVVYLDEMSYYPSGALKGFRRGNGVATAIERDSRGRPLSFEVSVPDDPTRKPLGDLFGQPCSGPAEHCGGSWGVNLTPIWNPGQHSYDGAGNITAIGANVYRYDELSRIVAADVSHVEADYLLSYEYDAFGNMTERVLQTVGISTDTQSFNVDKTTNRLGGIAYDPSGNLVDDGSRQYWFDPENRMIDAWEGDGQQVASYAYDANGHRVRAVAAGVETFYFRDAGGQILSEFQRAVGETGDAGWNRDYVNVAGQAVAVVKNEAPAQVARPTAGPVTPTSVTLHWEPVPDPDIAQYMIWRETDNPMEFPATFYLVCENNVCENPSFEEDITGIAGDAFYYKVRALDDAANSGPYSPLMVVRPHDDIAPSAPYNVWGEGFDGYVRLTWTGGSADDVQAYHVERKLAQGGSWALVTPGGSPVETTVYLDHTVTNGTGYRYRVRAIDTAGNESSNSAVSNLVRPRDWTPPGKPASVVGVPGQAAGTVLVAWAPSMDADVEGYTVYRSPQAGVLGDEICSFPMEGAFPEDYCQTVAVGTHALLDEDPQLAEGATYYYTVRAFDYSENISLPSTQVAARTRSTALISPSGFAAEFAIDERMAPFGGVPPADPSHHCEMAAETDDVVGVHLRWTPNDPAPDHYRVYRADISGTGVADPTTLYTLAGTLDPLVTPIDDPQDEIFEDPSKLDFMDPSLVGTHYSYYIVSVNGAGEESAASTVVDALDVFDASKSVRNLGAMDGRNSFPTENARSRRVKISWSRVVQHQLNGYHVYRRCKWNPSHTGGGGEYQSLPEVECIQSWVRLTETPVGDTVRSIEDRPGGLNGVYNYVVRPVGPDPTTGEMVEGPITKAIRVCLNINGEPGTDDAIEEGVPLQCLEDGLSHDINTKELADLDDQLEEINEHARGSGPSAGPPAKPIGLSVEELNNRPEFGATTITLRWLPNTEKDLAGYHVEMAGAPGGPWRRLTSHPIAWWAYYENEDLETDYVMFDAKALKDPDCANFRVIAVDEDGLESPPSDPDQWYAASSSGEFVSFGDYEPNLCGGFSVTPEAPQNLIAATETLGVEAWDTCETRLEWDEVPGAARYRVYRYSMPEILVANNPAYGFYRTEELDASACSGGTCSYIESGDYGAGSTCPWAAGFDPTCENDSLEAYYVTAVFVNGSGVASGESPRSAIVFWNCNEFHFPEGYAWRAPRPEPKEGDVLPTEPPVFYASNFAEEPVDVTPMQRERASTSVPRTAPLLTLGTNDPPYKIVDLHVDHLGSIRLTTDDYGQIESTHDYFPFGEEIQPMQDQFTKRMFTGHERDESTGLDYMLARYYSANTARFLSVDPTMASASSRLPQSWNRYAYVLNNPIANTDPDGRVTDIESYSANNRAENYQKLRETEAPLAVKVAAGAIGFLATAMVPGPEDAALAVAGSKLIGKAAGKIAGKLAGKGDDVVEVTVDASKHPQSAGHISDAQAAGHPDKLTIDRGGAQARRQEALSDTAPQAGKDRDEYPPAMFQEGGEGASVRHIDPSDNRGAGACMGNQCRGLPDGTTVKVKVKEKQQ